MSISWNSLDSTAYNRKINKRFSIIVLCLFLCFVTYKLYFYIPSPPIIRAAMVESTFSFSTKLVIDERMMDFFPIGSEKDFVLNTLRESGMRVTDIANEWFNKNRPSNQQQFFATTIISRGILSDHELRIIPVFENDKLIELKAYIFYHTL